MIVKKITSGFVVQTWDTKTETFISQEFVASDEVDYEDEHGDYPFTDEGLDSCDIGDLPFDMKQPTA